MGREVVIAVRKKRKGEPKHYSVICPAHWKKGQFLSYARSEHPDDTVKIVEWKPTCKDENSWEPRLWIANPSGFADYARGLVAR
jgi:hypothetical protein